MQMVIHDMRNPTVAIKFGLKNTLKLLSEMKHIVTNEHRDFFVRCQKLHDEITKQISL